MLNRVDRVVLNLKAVFNCNELFLKLHFLKKKRRLNL